MDSNNDISQIKYIFHSLGESVVKISLEHLKVITLERVGKIRLCRIIIDSIMSRTAGSYR